MARQRNQVHEVRANRREKRLRIVSFPLHGLLICTVCNVYIIRLVKIMKDASQLLDVQSPMGQSLHYLTKAGMQVAAWMNGDAKPIGGDCNACVVSKIRQITL